MFSHNWQEIKRASLLYLHGLEVRQTLIRKRFNWDVSKMPRGNLLCLRISYDSGFVFEPTSVINVLVFV